MYLDGNDKEDLFNNVKKLLEIQNNKTLALKASVFLWREIQKEKDVLIGWLMLVFAVAVLWLANFVK